MKMICTIRSGRLNGRNRTNAPITSYLLITIWEYTAKILKIGVRPHSSFNLHGFRHHGSINPTTHQCVRGIFYAIERYSRTRRRAPPITRRLNPGTARRLRHPHPLRRDRRIPKYIGTPISIVRMKPLTRRGRSASWTRRTWPGPNRRRRRCQSRKITTDFCAIMQDPQYAPGGDNSPYIKGYGTYLTSDGQIFHLCARPTNFANFFHCPFYHTIFAIQWNRDEGRPSRT